MKDLRLFTEADWIEWLLLAALIVLLATAVVTAFGGVENTLKAVGLR
jgi:hypothetical protein